MDLLRQLGILTTEECFLPPAIRAQVQLAERALAEFVLARDRQCDTTSLGADELRELLVGLLHWCDGRGLLLEDVLDEAKQEFLEQTDPSPQLEKEDD